MSTNRRVGLSALTRPGLASAYASHGANLRSTHASSLATQLSVFQQLLHQFALTHAKDIRSNPQFRAEFARMCNAIGVDPLASSHTRSRIEKSGETSGKGRFGGWLGGGGTNNGEGGSMWSQMLGGSVNDFYFDLAVRVVEICRSTRAENGGLIPLTEVRMYIQRGTQIGGGMEVSDDDVLRSVDSLAPLCPGIKVMKFGHKQMIRSVPKEFNGDQSVVLEAIMVMGYVTISMLQVNLGWESPRCRAVMEDLVGDGMVWIDRQAGETEYWSPGVIQSR